MFADGAKVDDGWYAHMQQQSSRLHRELSQSVAKIHEKVKNPDTLPNSQKSTNICTRCRRVTHKVELVSFECHPEKRTKVKYEGGKDNHQFCMRCLDEYSHTQSKYLSGVSKAPEDDDPETKSNREQADTLIALARNNVRIIPCLECKTPNVICSEQRFGETVERSRTIHSNGLMTVYVKHREATFRLVNNFVVERVIENQRRPLFGSFSKDNLLITDWGGQYTDDSHAEVPDKISRLPNAAWFWIEKFDPDTARCDVDRNGWQYGAFSWSSRFTKTVSMFNLVRRRRMLHTRLRLNEEAMVQIRQLGETYGQKAKEASTRGAGGRTGMQHDPNAVDSTSAFSPPESPQAEPREREFSMSI